MSDIKGVEISDVLGLSQPLTKLVETTSKHWGNFVEPFHVKRMGKAKAKEIESICDAIQHKINLPVKYENGQLMVDSSDSVDIIKRAQIRRTLEAVNEERNIETIYEYAYNDLLGIENVSEKPVDNDWIDRFFDYAKHVNDETLQTLWGKILAGEVTQPGSFSLRTLDVIRNISKEEAEVFKKITPFVILFGHSAFVAYPYSLLEKYGIKFSDLLVLEECGILNFKHDICTDFHLTTEPNLILYNRCACIITNNTIEDQKLVVGCYPLTIAGRDLCRILEYKSNLDYFFDFADLVFKVNKEKIEMSIYNIQSFDGDNIDYDDIPIKTYNVKP